jgi:hypothetical protein
VTDTQVEPATTTTPTLAPSLGLLQQAKEGRARIARDLGRVQAARPATAAGPVAQASWLRDKAAVHDQIAGYLRGIGDIHGAVEVEVLASRCRIDARDLTTSAADATEPAGREAVLSADGPCCVPSRPAAARPPSSATTCRGLVDLTQPARGRGTDHAALDGVLVTCGPGLP